MLVHVECKRKEVYVSVNVNALVREICKCTASSCLYR